MVHSSLHRLAALTLLSILLGALLVACGTTSTGGGQPTLPSDPAAPLPTASVAAPAANVLRVVPAGGVWPDTLDPQKMSISNEIAVVQLAYEGLTRFDNTLQTVPAAAESWQYNTDATVVTFTLRTNLTYADGEPLTAQSFVYAVHRTLDPREPGNYQTVLDMIVGADAVINATMPDDEAKLPELLDGVMAKATDERTLVFTLVRPTPYFHSIAALWVLFPVRQELVEQGGPTWWESAQYQVGNGPFMFDTIDRSDNLIRFVPNPGYWAGAPQLRAVEYRYISDATVALQAYKSGEIDIMYPDPNDVPTILADTALSQEFLQGPGSCTFAYEINLTIPPFDNPKVREAFAYGFDREGFVRDALKDTAIATLTWIPPGMPGHEPTEAFAYNPEKARQLLAEAGFPDGQGLPEVRWSYNANNPANQARVEYIVQMYQNSLGVTVTPDPVEGTTLSNLRKEVSTHPQIVLGGWCSDYPDPQNWLSVYWSSSSNFARSIGYTNPQLDSLLAQADVEINPERRLQLYAEAQRIVIADQAHLMLAHSKNYYLVSPAVKGLVMTAQDSDVPGVTLGLRNVTVER